MTDSKLQDTFNIMQKEPNYETFEYKGYKCMIKRSMEMGHFCGYVGLPKEHKFYQKGYDDINIDCHGGLTFTDFWEEENDGFWYIGFDCAHYRDYMPYLRMQLSQDVDPESQYKDINFVRNECKSIVDQLLKQ